MKYTLDEANLTAEVWVDDNQLHRGDPEGVDLTDNQVERLEQAGVSLSEAEVGLFEAETMNNDEGG